MSKNDDRILELKKQIETKKKAISEKKVRFIPETNCVLNMDGMTINLNVCSDDTLLLLLIRLNSYLMSAKDLNMADFEIVLMLHCLRDIGKLFCTSIFGTCRSFENTSFYNIMQQTAYRKNRL